MCSLQSLMGMKLSDAVSLSKLLAKVSFVVYKYNLSIVALITRSIYEQLERFLINIICFNFWIFFTFACCPFATAHSKNILASQSYSNQTLRSI